MELFWQGKDLFCFSSVSVQIQFSFSSVFVQFQIEPIERHCNWIENLKTEQRQKLKSNNKYNRNDDWLSRKKIRLRIPSQWPRGAQWPHPPRWAGTKREPTSSWWEFMEQFLNEFLLNNPMMDGASNCKQCIVMVLPSLIHHSITL